MQYLAELKKTQSMLGTTVEVRLLARNVSDNSWQPVTGDETLKIDQNLAKELKDGQLVLADISTAKNVQTLQEASKRLILLLQNFSRLEQKYKQGEEDIEQWKQSLNYQTQELHRREVELEEKQQQFEDLESKRYELEGLEERLHKQQQEMAAEQEKLTSQTASMNTEEAQYLFSLSQQIALSNGGGQAGEVAQLLQQGQAVLNGFWQQVDSQKHQAEQEQNESELAGVALFNQKQVWLNSFSDRLRTELTLGYRQETLNFYEQRAFQLDQQINDLGQLSHQVNGVLKGLGGVVEVLPPDQIEQLEAMPIAELEAALQSWESDFDGFTAFVGAQEDELADLQGQIADLQSQINRADDFERIEMESDKEFKEEQCQFLESTLAGQRQNLCDRQATLEHQRSIYERRQGIVNSDNLTLTLKPVFNQLEELKANLQQELGGLNQRIVEIRESLTQQQQSVQQKLGEEHSHQQQLDQLEQQLRERLHNTSYLWGVLAQQDQLLQPVQDIVDGINQQLNSGENQTNSQQASLIGELQQRIAAMLPEGLLEGFPQVGDMVLGA